MTPNIKVTIAHLGARKHYQEPILFYQWEILDTFYTDFYAKSNFLNQLLRSKIIYSRLPKSIKKMVDRYAVELEGAKIVDFPLWGMQYPIKLKKAISLQETYDIFIRTGQEFNQKIIAQGLCDSNVVYGFNSASLELFQFAKNNKVKCVLDQTLAEKSLEHRLLSQEEEQWPGWSKSPFCIHPSMTAKFKREKQEQEIADHIICGSSFVKQSLIESGINSDKISVVSLGRSNTQAVSLNCLTAKTKEKNRPLRILFAGSVGLRKGVPYLLEALKLLKNSQIPFECKLAGDIAINGDKINDYSEICEFLGRVPRSEMDKLYRWADVFVLPSICEGSAMVTYEAMIYGLPIITTFNTGSIVRDGLDGFIVPIRDPQAIANKLLDVYNNPKQFANFQARADYLEFSNAKATEKLKQVLQNLTQ
jgi:glycosyltransferase involved in cell wall biosynthesis